MSAPEQRFIETCVKRLPAALTPDHLSIMALFGAILAGISVVLSWYSPLGVVGFLAGLTLHWFGDSFDGALARFRHIERPKAGLLIDRGGDVLAYLSIVGGLGFSPYLSPVPALLLLVGILLNAVFTLLLNITEKKQVVGFGGLGGTEGRILLALWVIGWHLVGGVHAAPPALQLGWFEAISFLLLIVACAVFTMHIMSHISDYARLEVKHIFGNDASQHTTEINKQNNVVNTIFVAPENLKGRPARHFVGYKPVVSGKRSRR